MMIVFGNDPLHISILCFINTVYGENFGISLHIFVNNKLVADLYVPKRLCSQTFEIRVKCFFVKNHFFITMFHNYFLFGFTTNNPTTAINNIFKSTFLITSIFCLKVRNNTQYTDKPRQKQESIIFLTFRFGKSTISLSVILKCIC